MVRDIRKGFGAVLRHGDRMIVDFAGIPYGESLRTTPATKNKPEALKIDEVLQGWTEGLPGMRVGGRRELIVPARLGDAGTTMIYQVDLIAAGRYRSPGAGL